MSQEIQVHAIFKGNVQGIGFRATGRYFAQQLGLNGTIRNREDGSVEMHVQGTKEAIDKLIQQMQTEFGQEYIQAIDQTVQPIIQKIDGFHIVR
jgi:acylphosphatase